MTRYPNSHGWGRYIALKPTMDGRRILIGTCGATLPIELNDDPEIGYGMLPAYQRRGYATEAVAALIAWIFFHPHVRSVNAQTFPHLQPSLGVLAKTWIPVRRPRSGAGGRNRPLSEMARMTGCIVASCTGRNSRLALLITGQQSRANIIACNAHLRPGFFSFFFFFHHSLHSQQLSTRSWKGLLHDAAGAPIKDAEIHLIGGHGEMVAETQADGRFAVRQSAAGELSTRRRNRRSRPQLCQASRTNAGFPASRRDPRPTRHSHGYIPKPASRSRRDKRPEASSFPARPSAPFRSTSAISASCCCSPPAP